MLNKNTINLTRETFDKFKGFLILLIICEHTQLIFTGHFRSWIATFYVSLFLVLPFLFNNDQFNINNIIKVLKRYYIPFFLFLSLSVVLFTIVVTQKFNIGADFFFALTIATNPLIKKVAGSSYLWFFPVLISTLLLLMFYNSTKNKIIFIGVMIFMHFTITLIDKQYLNLFPLNSAVAIYLFSLGIAISYLYHNYLKQIYIYRYYVILLFFIASFLFYGDAYWYAIVDLPNITKITSQILFDIIQVSAFFTILFLAYSIQIPYLEWIGKKSIIIYTIHPLIIFAFNFLFHWHGIAQGAILFILAIIFSSVVAFGIEFIKLDKYVYPR